MGNKGRFSGIQRASSATTCERQRPTSSGYGDSAAETRHQQSAAMAATTTTTTTMLLSSDTECEQKRGADLGLDGAGYNACENPTKITHCFWLQQYSWLHHDNALGCASTPATTNSACTSPAKRKKRNSSSQPSPRQIQTATMTTTKSCPSTTATTTTRRHRLLVRWSNLMRTFGGSTGDQLGGQQANVASVGRCDEQPRPGSSSAPARDEPVSSGAPIGMENWQQQPQPHQLESRAKQPLPLASSRLKKSRCPSKGAQNDNNNNGDGRDENNNKKKQRCSWFLKSLSSSTSTLLAPLSSRHSSQQQKRRQARVPKSGKGQLKLLDDGGDSESDNDDEGEEGERDKSQSRSRSSCELPQMASPKHSSPYRQIVLAIARRSPVRRFVGRQESQRAAAGSTSTVAAGGGQILAGTRGGADVEAAGEKRTAEQVEVAAPFSKRSRLAQFARASRSSSPAAGSKVGGGGGGAGLLSSIFGSPLFRRAEQIIATSTGDEEQATTTDPKRLIGGGRDEKGAAEQIRASASANRGGGQSGAQSGTREGGEKGGSRRGQSQATTEPSSGSQAMAGGPEVGAARPSEATTVLVEFEASEAYVSWLGGDQNREEGEESASSQQQQQQEREQEVGEEKPSQCASACALQSSSFEFKFQLEEREYYANELTDSDARAPTIAKKASTLEEEEACAKGNSDNEREREGGERALPVGRVAVSKRARAAQLVRRSQAKCEQEEEEHAELRGQAGRDRDETQLETTVDTVGASASASSSVSVREASQPTAAMASVEAKQRQRTTGASRQPLGGQIETTLAATEMADESAPELGSFAPVGEPTTTTTATATSTMMMTVAEQANLLPLIMPQASSSSSLASSSILLDSSSQPGLEWDETLSLVAGTTRISIAVEGSPRQEGSSTARSSGERSRGRRPTDGAEQLESPERPALQPANSSTVVFGVGGQRVLLSNSPSTTITTSSTTATTTASRETPPAIQRQKVAQAPSSGVGILKSNFKKLVKRQQSVDSYRMAREQKSKLKRQQETRNKHQSNEAIKSTKSVGDDQPVSVRAQRKYSVAASSSVAAVGSPIMVTTVSQTTTKTGKLTGQQLRICIDPYAKPGSFTLPGEGQPEQEGNQSKATTTTTTAKKPVGKRTSPTPPNTLSLMGAISGGQTPGAFVVGSFSGCITPTYPTHHLPSPKYVSPAMQASKKYSNASTISSLLGGDSSIGGNSSYGGGHSGASSFQVSSTSQRGGSGSAEPSATSATVQATQVAQAATTSANLSDTESSLGGSATPSRGLALGGNSPSNLASSGSQARGSAGGRQSSSGSGITSALATFSGLINNADVGGPGITSGQPGAGGGGAGATVDTTATAAAISAAAFAAQNRASLASALSGEQTAEAALQAAAALEEAAAAAAAARRANLAEHIYDNKCGLGEDMKFLASLPELCDITFLVGETREPVCAVKSVLAARSRVFHKILFGNRVRSRFVRQPNNQQSQQDTIDCSMEYPWQQQQQENRRSSSPKAPLHKSLVGKSSSPMSRSTSPNQPQPWSVTSDASGYNPMSSSAAAERAPSGDGETMGSALLASIGTATTAAGHHHQQQPNSGGSALAATTGAGTRSGRVSVASNGRESVSQASQGSQQPLIIGPGQTAAPAPPAKRNKKSSIRDSSHHGGSRLSRMFMKRASDPSIKHSHLANSNHSNQNYLDKMSSSQMSTTMIIEEFEPDVFRQLIEYIHTGCVLLQARTLLGLLNAADYYGLEQLRKACLRFVSCCITVDTVCSLLSTAERYIQYKCTKSIVQKVLEFVDTHADEIFKLNAFGLLPEHVVRLILARDGLKADEQVKYSGVYTWCEHYCRSYELTNISDVMRNFLDLIEFHKIPTNVLLSEIYPTHIVPDNIFLSALAYQADPENFEPEPMRARRMTLPNPCTVYRDFDADHAGYGGHGPTSPGAGAEQPATNWSSSSASKVNRKSSQQQARQTQPSSTGTGDSFDSQLALGTRDAVRGRKSTGSQPDSKARKLRKGSIAQVSVSGVMRKLSIRKRHSNISAGASAAEKEARRRGSGTGAASSVGSASGRHSAVSKQQSIADAMQLGQQILNAYLAQQKQRELERAERERREQLERKAAEEAKRRAEVASDQQQQQQHSSATGTTFAAGQSADDGGCVEGPDNGVNAPEDSSSSQQQQQQEQQQQDKPIVKSSSTRKSFKDFKHISRRIFMRHSSSKILQQTSSVSGFFGGGHNQQQQLQQQTQTDISGKDKDNRDKRRNVLKIRRSETVFETTSTSAQPPNSCPRPKLSSSIQRASGEHTTGR